MQYEKKATIWNIGVLASFAMLVGFLIRFRGFISGHIAGRGATGIEPYSYFMVAIAFASVFILLIYGIGNERRSFIWLAVLYVLSACISTTLSGLYPAARLPFRFVEMFYWVAVMILSYYSVLHLKTAKFHVAIVVLALPVLSYSFYVMRHAESVYSGTLLLNPVYFISYFLPVVLLLRPKVLKVGGLLLIFVIVVLSYKRLAIMAYMSSILVYFYYLSFSGEKAKVWRIAILSLGAIMLIGLLAFTFRYLAAAFGLDWSERMRNIASGGGGGRIMIWRVLLADLASHPAYWLFGKGYMATEITSISWAHNDFLEIFYDFGVMGIILYLMFVGKIICIFFEMKRFNYKHFAAFAASLVWFAWGSMFSMLVIIPYWFLSLAFFWGITIADFENAKIQAYISEFEESLYETQYYYDNAEEELYQYNL